MKSFAYLALIAVGVGSVIIVWPRRTEAASPAAVPHRPYDSALAAHEVNFNLARVRRDPGGAIGWRQLASAYLTEARQKEDPKLAIKAQQAAERSLSIRKARNAGAAILIADALLEQHRFEEAHQACETALAIEPGADAAERTMTDIDFELGRYDEAGQRIAAHPDWRKDPAGMALMARQAETYGHPDQAEMWLTQAVQTADADYELPATTVSWFHVKLGELQTRYGRYDQANKQLKQALALYPESWKALAAMARLCAKRRDNDGVLWYGKQLDEVAPMTDVVGLMEDAARTKGDESDADLYAKYVLKLNQSTIDLGVKPHTPAQLKNGHTHDRMFCLYLAEHGKMLDLAQHAATHELASRKDIYSYDTYAWVTFLWGKAKGSRIDVVEAKQSIDKALATGTKDPQILAHAKAIDDYLQNN
ncbi:MAG: tetratricopeptide repeat protein [Armatimonadetes bacterium]|nr:tetratricopeptide repeat protein [Armatimonadota bacterium]